VLRSVGGLGGGLGGVKVGGVRIGEVKVGEGWGPEVCVRGWLSYLVGGLWVIFVKLHL